MGPGLRRDDRCECRASFGSRALRGLHHHDIAVGAVVHLRRRMALEVIAASQADELMVITAVYDHAARKKSYSLLAEAFGLQKAAAS